MSQRRVLIVRVGAMGDVLHALPAVAALRALHPDAAIDWVVDERWAPLLTAGGDTPLVDRVWLAQTRLWSRAPFSRATVRSILGLRSDLRSESYDCVVDLQGTLRSAVIARLTGGPARVGFADPREGLARAFYTKTLSRQGTHVVSQNASLLGDALGLTLKPVTPTLPHSPAAAQWAADVMAAPGSRTALLATTAGWGAKEWPAERFGALAGRLADRGWRVLLNAAHGADAVPRAALAASKGRAELVSPGVDGLVALTRRVSLVVGGDTGPVHLAAVLGVPTVALFGPTAPERNGPWGFGAVAVLRSAASRTSHKRVPGVDPGLASLSVDEVLQAVEAVTDLDGVPTARSAKI